MLVNVGLLLLLLHLVAGKVRTKNLAGESYETLPHHQCSHISFPLYSRHQIPAKDLALKLQDTCGFDLEIRSIMFTM